MRGGAVCLGGVGVGREGGVAAEEEEEEEEGRVVGVSSTMLLLVVLSPACWLCVCECERRQCVRKGGWKCCFARLGRVSESSSTTNAAIARSQRCPPYTTVALTHPPHKHRQAVPTGEPGGITARLLSGTLQPASLLPPLPPSPDAS
jgi:hypothetical protein